MRIKDCKAGLHHLVEIYRSKNCYDEYDVVNWCKCCGSIVVDTELDNRLYPGRIMKMKSPQFVKENG